MPDRPNILVMLTDDHGQWAAGCYGNREIHTPTMDWMARTGCRFANATTETPVCSPARGCFWTGLYPSQHGIHDYIQQPNPEVNDRDWLADQTQLGELLHRAGYLCGAFGKEHTGRPETPRPGYDAWFINWRRTGPHRGEDLPFSDHGERVEIAGYNDQIVADRAIDWLRARDRSQPFFCYVGPVATHSPYGQHPPRLVEQYAEATFDDIPADEPIYPWGRQTGEGKNAGRADWRRRQMEYYAAVSHIDEQLGRILDTLEQQGELENTIVVYTADHGLNCGHHGLWGKGNATRPYNILEESVRIPMLIAGWEGLFGRQVRPEFVNHCDLFMTLLDIAGAELPAGRHWPGRSFAPMIREARGLADWRSAHIGEYGDLRMARDQTHKLIRRHGRGLDQLFDLLADPRETRNVIADPASVPAIQRLDAALDAHFAPMADSPNSGLLVEQLPTHNPVEAWRGEPA